MVGFLKKIFSRFLISIVNASNHEKCVYLNNQQCMTQLNLINLHLNEYSQRLCYCQ